MCATLLPSQSRTPESEVPVGLLGQVPELQGSHSQEGVLRTHEVKLLFPAAMSDQLEVLSSQELLSRASMSIVLMDRSVITNRMTEPRYEVGHARLLVGMHMTVKAVIYPDRLYINV